MDLDISGDKNIRFTVVVPFKCEKCDLEKKLFVPVECVPGASIKGGILTCTITGGAKAAVPECDCGQELKASGPGKLEVN